MGIKDRLSHAWNALRNEEEKFLRPETYPLYGSTHSVQSYRTPMGYSNDRSIVSSIINRIAIDVASIDIRHVVLDDEDRYASTKKSGLNNCFSLEANVDQIAVAFKQDAVMSMLDKGFIALVAVDTTLNPDQTGGYDVTTMRVGEVVAWYPRHVRVSIWDDREEHGGVRREVTLPKTQVAVIENPLYSVMNDTNSTLKRLTRKLALLDAIDEQSASGKLDLIIQLPYVVKSEARRADAERRRKDIEVQLQGSKYGVAYADGTEKIIQLNRPVENNLLGTVEFLTNMLYGELGITKEVMDGTADEATMLNYWNRTIEPILTALTQSTMRTFLTKTARTQRQAVKFFRDPFKLIPIAQVAEIADKLTRNEILTANEFRGIIGFRPSTDPKANELRNSNVPQPMPGQPPVPEPVPEPKSETDTT